MLLLKSESPSPKKCDHGDQGLERQIESDGSWRVKYLLSLLQTQSSPNLLPFSVLHDFCAS